MTGPAQPPPGWQQPPPGYPQYYPPPYPVRGTNGLAIASLVCAFVFAPLGIVFGVMARNQIRRTGEEGDGMALAGIIISVVFTVVTIVTIFVIISVFSIAAPDGSP